MSEPQGLDDDVSRSLYEEGRSGIDVAEYWITVNMIARIEVVIARAADPAAFPQYDDSPHVVARRVVGHLLGAGWRPPDDDWFKEGQQP